MVAGLAALVVGFFFPGFGAAVAGQLRWALIWAVAVVALFLAVFLSPWAVWLSLAARVAGAFQGGWFVYRADRRAWFTPYTLATGGAHVIANLMVYSFLLEGFAAPSSSMSPTLAIGDHVFADKLTPLFSKIDRGDVIIFHYPCDERRDYLKRVIGVGGDTVEVRCHVVYVNGKALPTAQVSARTTYLERYEEIGKWQTPEVSEYSETLGGHAYHVFSSTERPATGGEPETRMDFPHRGRPFGPSCTDSADSYGDASPARKLSGSGKIVETKPESASACEQQVHYVVPPHTLFTMGDNHDNSNDSRVWGVVSEDAVIGRVSGIWLSKAQGYSWGRVGKID